MPDHLYRVAVVVVNLESHLLVVTVLLAQVEEPVRFRCPQAKSARHLKKRRSLHGADVLLILHGPASRKVQKRSMGDFGPGCRNIQRCSKP